MTTFFPHLYEYGKLVNLIKEYEKNNENQNQRKRRFSNDILDKIETKCLTLTKNSLSFDQSRQSTDIDFLIYLEIKAQKLRESNYNPKKYYNVSLDKILKERTELTNINRYQKPSDWPQSPAIHISNYKKICFSAARHWMIIDFVLCVEIAKILPFFGKLTLNDQEELLKSITMLNSLFTQAYYSFSVSCDSMIFPDGSVPSMFAHLHGLQSDIFHRIVEPIKRIQMTKEEYILLKTIIFCSSKSEFISLKGREILENEFQKYSNILLKHLQAKYGDAPGAVRYSQILSVMEAMTYFTQKAKEFYFYVGASFPQQSGHELTNSELIKQIIY